MILLGLWCLPCFTSRSYRNQTWRFRLWGIFRILDFGLFLSWYIKHERFTVSCVHLGVTTESPIKKILRLQIYSEYLTSSRYGLKLTPPRFAVF